MLKNPVISPAQPKRAKTRLVPGKAAASEEASRCTLRYVEPSERCENDAGELFQHPASI